MFTADTNLNNARLIFPLYLYQLFSSMVALVISCLKHKHFSLNVALKVPLFGVIIGASVTSCRPHAEVPSSPDVLPKPQERAAALHRCFNTPQLSVTSCCRAPATPMLTFVTPLRHRDILSMKCEDVVSRGLTRP